MTMKTCSRCGETKLKSEFHKDTSKKDSLCSRCKACASKHNATWCVANPEKAKAAYAAWRRANQESAKATEAAYRSVHREEARSRSAAWRKANPEKEKATKAARYILNAEKLRPVYAAYRASNQEKIKAAIDKWRVANRNKINATNASRRARKLQATPIWADKRFIDLWYTGASIMTQLTGKPYHVDHAVPLKSKLVCGLHAPANMQILPGAENKSKGNRWWPDMPQRRA